MQDSTQRRTRDEILADWEKSRDEPDPNAKLDKRAALLDEALHLNPAPREMWCWVVGAFAATRTIQKAMNG